MPLKLCIITGKYIVPTITSNEVVPTSYVCAQKLCMYLPLKLCIITELIEKMSPQEGRTMCVPRLFCSVEKAPDAEDAVNKLWCFYDVQHNSRLWARAGKHREAVGCFRDEGRLSRPIPRHLIGCAATPWTA